MRRTCDAARELISHPAAHGLIGDHDPTLGQQIFDVAKAQAEPDIKLVQIWDDVSFDEVADLQKRGRYGSNAEVMGIMDRRD